MMSDKNNSLWLATQYLSTMIFSFITLKLNLDHFGSELFGMWIVIASLFGFGSSLDLGFGIALIKFIAEANKEDDTEKINSYISSGIIVFIGMGIIILAFIYTIAFLFYFSNNKIIPLPYYQTGSKIFILLSMNFYLRYLSNIFRATFEGLNNFVITSRFSIVSDVSIFISILFIIYLDLSLIVLAVCHIIVSSVYLLMYFILMRYIYRKIQVKFSKFNFVIVKNLLKFSVGVQITTIFSALLDPLIKYVIGNYSSLNTISLYEIGRRFAFAITGLFFNVFRTILPKAGVIKTVEESRTFIKEEIVKTIKIGITYSGVTFGIGSIIIGFIIKIWFNYDDAILVFLILALPASINNFGYPIYTFIMGSGKANFLALIQFINLVAVFISLTIGFKIFHSYLGLYGYSLSVIIGNCLMLLFIRKNIGFSIRALLIDVNFYKLIILTVLLLLSVSVSFTGSQNIFVSLGFLFIISLSVFINDIKNYYKIFLKSFRSVY